MFIPDFAKTDQHVQKLKRQMDMHVRIHTRTCTESITNITIFIFIFIFYFLFFFYLLFYFIFFFEGTESILEMFIFSLLLCVSQRNDRNHNPVTS